MDKTKEQEEKEIDAAIQRLKEIASQESVSLKDLIEYYENRYIADKKRILNTHDYLQTLIDNGEPEEEFRNEHMRVAVRALEAMLSNKNITASSYSLANIAQKAYDTSRELLLKFENKNFKEKKDE